MLYLIVYENIKNGSDTHNNIYQYTKGNKDVDEVNKRFTAHTQKPTTQPNTKINLNLWKQFHATFGLKFFCI